MPEDFTNFHCRGRCLGGHTPECGAEEPTKGFVCTLPHRHEGSHVACGGPDVHDLKIWD